MPPTIDWSKLTVAQLADACHAQVQQRPATIAQALETVLASAEKAKTLFEQQQTVAAQSALENALLEVILASRQMQLQLPQALNRALLRRNTPANLGKRIMKVFRDRVELWVGNQHQGGWPLFSQDDLEAAHQIARDLDCEVQPVGQANSQLRLFQTGMEATEEADSGM